MRVLGGPRLGEPASGWSALSFALAVEPPHVRDAAQSGDTELLRTAARLLHVDRTTGD